MILRYPINVDAILYRRHVERVQATVDAYQDEASEHALAGRPRRAWYVQHMAERVPWMVDDAEQRQRARAGRTA